MSLVSSVNVRRFAKLWNKNVPVEVIAAEFKLTQRKLYKLAWTLRKQRPKLLVRRRVANHTKIKEDQFLREWESPKSLARIAQEHGVTVQALCSRARRLRSRGITLRERPAGRKSGAMQIHGAQPLPISAAPHWEHDLVHSLKVRISNLVENDRMAEAATAMLMLKELEAK